MNDTIESLQVQNKRLKRKNDELRNLCRKHQYACKELKLILGTATDAPEAIIAACRENRRVLDRAPSWLKQSKFPQS